MSLRAVQMSKDRAEGVRRQLVKTHPVDAKRLEVIGRGWDEPVGDSERNRRVEAQWFLIE
jgi:NitT/TauT family transport system substrate-binding protein